MCQTLLMSNLINRSNKGCMEISERRSGSVLNVQLLLLLLTLLPLLVEAIDLWKNWMTSLAPFIPLGEPLALSCPVLWLHPQNCRLRLSGWRRRLCGGLLIL